ncbi:MAG: FtsX-like permease family protein [Mucilaginibacter sp.]|nr:FtsX-like permease family protein [Mucilaginibacter sp.]
MLGILIGTAALIIVLSVFNGLEKVIFALNSNFSPELRIEAKLGKTFNPNIAYLKLLHKDTRLLSYTEVLQDWVVMEYGEKRAPGHIKGVSDDFLKNPRLDSTILDGSFTLHLNASPMAVIGVTIQNNLSVNVNNTTIPLQIYAPRRTNSVSINPADDIINRSIYPAGIFSIQQEDDDFIIVPLDFARELLDQPVVVSSIDLNFKKGNDVAALQQEIQDKLGQQFTVKTRQQQNTELYKTLNYEKWAVFMILAFVVVIAAFNIIGSLTMLVIDKRKDIAILSSLGANRRLIQGIFFFEGLMISLIGCIAGLLLGLVFCILQQRYGLIEVGGKISAPNNAYPVQLKADNFVLVFLTVAVIAVIASGISARLSVKGLDDIKQDL